MLGWNICNLKYIDSIYENKNTGESDDDVGIPVFLFHACFVPCPAKPCCVFGEYEVDRRNEKDI